MRKLLSSNALIAILGFSAAAAAIFSSRWTSAPPGPESLATGPLDIALVDGQERATSLQAIISEGQTISRPWTVVFFGYLTCPDICPMTLSWASAEFRELGARADALQLVLISVDPARDAPADLDRYVKHFDPRFKALTGTEDNLRSVAKALGAHFEIDNSTKTDAGYLVHHSGSVLVLGPKGEIVETISPPLLPGKLVEVGRRLIPDRADPLVIEGARLVAPPPGGKSTAIYMTLRNEGQVPLIVTAATVDGAERVEFHETKASSHGSTGHSMMKMARLSQVVVEPQARVDMAPGGLHVMVMGLRKEFVPGSKVAMTLSLGSGKTHVVDVDVQGAN